MIKETIEADLKQALLGGDKELVTTLRTLKGSILDLEISSGKRAEGLSDDEVIKVLSKEHKKRIESAKIYTEVGDSARSDKEIWEAEVISKYLPEMMSQEEIETIAKQVISDFNAEVSMQNMGQIIGQVKAKTGALADGSLIASVVKNLIGK